MGLVHLLYIFTWLQAGDLNIALGAWAQTKGDFTWLMGHARPVVVLFWVARAFTVALPYQDSSKW